MSTSRRLFQCRGAQAIVSALPGLPTIIRSWLARGCFALAAGFAELGLILNRRPKRKNTNV